MKNIFAILSIGICLTGTFFNHRYPGFSVAKKKEEMNITEARNRVQTEAVLITITGIGKQVLEYLKME